MKRIPLHSRDLIAELDKLYPEVNHGPRADPNDVLFYRGQRSVVLHLKKQLEQGYQD